MSTSSFTKTHAWSDVTPDFIAPELPAPIIKMTLEPYRFSVEKYRRLGELTILPSDSRTELLDGLVFNRSPIGAHHAQCVELLSRILAKITPMQWSSFSQRPITFPTSEPQPDACVVRGPMSNFGGRHPQYSETAVIIEVADSTLASDRGFKSIIYAAAGIPEYWIVNLLERTLEVYRKPIAAAGERTAHYESIEVLGAEQAVEVVLDGQKIGDVAVRDMLP